MKFDFETQDFVNTLQEMLQDYGRMALMDGRKCYSLWLDYAPQLPEEGELLKLFLELGLGKQVVELKNQSDDQRKAWSKSAVESMMQKGESRKDAECLVDAVLMTLGWGVKQAPVVPKEAVTTPAKEPMKNVSSKQGEKGRSTKNVTFQREEKNKATKQSKQKDDKQVKAKKSDPILDLVKQELQARWLHIVEAYLPKAFPQIHKVDFEHLQLPKNIMDVMEKHLGKSVIQQHKFLAYGEDEQKGIWIVLTDSSIMVYSTLLTNNFFVATYQQIRKMNIKEYLVIFNGDDGWKKELAMGTEGYYLVAMLRLIQGKVGDEVITRGEWQGIFAYNGYLDKATDYYIGINEVPNRKQKNLRTWMNSVPMGFQEKKILAVIDETAFKSCKDATVVAEDAIYHKLWGTAWGIYISDIQCMETKGSYLYITQKSGQKVALWHMGGGAVYFHGIIQAYIFIKQNSH